MADGILRDWGAAGVRASLYADTVSWNPAAAEFYRAAAYAAPGAQTLKIFVPNYTDLTEEQLAHAEDECAAHIMGSTLLYSSEEL
ncbi:hypothetical protein [Methylobacterium brachiatum]|uniref:hypothetical protein n=1 Tax=Methylobacterium brachiatum TaxID=269660 RepID=UPI0013CEFA7A|nr:hypothetical protein [Methylobacterium brachiatum]